MKKKIGIGVVLMGLLIAATAYAQTWAGDQKFLKSVEIIRALTVNGAVTMGSSASMAGTLSVDTIGEKTSAAGVTIDSVLLKDGAITGTIASPSSLALTATNAAGGSANPFDITSALGIMNGSDDYTAVDLNITNANHTGASNTVQAIDISGITGDADATETAIKIGDGWDVGINAGNNSITTTGTVGGGAATFTSGSFSDGNVTNVGDIALDSISTDNTSGLITLKGVGGAANNEDMTFDFETTPDTVGVSSSTGVTAVDFGAIGLAAGSADFSDGNITNVGSIGLDSVLSDAATGLVTIGGSGGAANNENLVFDFESTADSVGVSSGTGATSVDFGSIGLAAGSYDASDGDLTNVGNVQLDSLEADAAAGTIAMKGNAAGGTNKEDLVFDFEAVADTVGVSSTTGVTILDLGALALYATGMDAGDSDIANVGNIAVDSIEADAAAGTIVLQGNQAGGTNKEDLVLDFETAADTVGLSSTTGVTAVDFGAIAVKATGLDAGDADIENVGAVKVDSVEADGTTVNYMDVNLIELEQADLDAGSCTANQVKIDNGGATKELCFCAATNTWYCWSADSVNGPTD